MLPWRTLRGLMAPLVVLVLGLCVINVLAQSRKPYTKDAIVYLLTHDVPPQRVAALARQRGIDFQITPEVESELRRAGATAELLATLRELAPKPPAPAKPPEKPTEIIVQTSPDAQVYLDDSFKGEASPEGRLVIDNPQPGGHSLRVTLAGKKNYEQQITVAAGQTANIQAALADLAGSIRVQTSPGAEVFLDDSSRGTADAGGGLTISDVAPGSHQLRVSAQGKKEFRQSVTVLAGQENTTQATLMDVEKPPVEVPKPPTTAGPTRENPKDGLKYVWIPPGTFMMGCSPGDNECRDDEKPSHQVTVTRGFWMGQTVVTAGAYKRFAWATGHYMPFPPLFNNARTNENMPIVKVTWDDATAYCGWTGGRLPTEAEWEYAARGGSTQARYGNLHDIAWYHKNSGFKPHNVAQKRPNGFGLYDMLGNVREWVNDWYDQNYYQSSPSQDPTGPTHGLFRVERGGSWLDDPRVVRVSYRYGSSPGYGFDDFGFRCGGDVFAP
jgi:formylglycine-generating enzyme required for sulfatase activity